MSGQRPRLDATLRVLDSDGDIGSQTPRHSGFQQADGRSSLNDHITIAVYSPSNADLSSPRNDQHEAFNDTSTPVPPSRSLHATPANDSTSNSQGRGTSPSSRSPSSSNGVSPVRPARFTDASTIRRDGFNQVAPPSSFPAHLVDSPSGEGSTPGFTAVDPFAPKRHRLSWSSILKVKDGRRRPVRSASDAWAIQSPTQYEENDALSGYDVEDRNSSEIAVMDGEPLSAFPEETYPASIRHSAPSTRSEYKSFEEEKIKKTPTFQEPVSVYNPQPNSTMPAGVGNQPAPSLRFAKQVTIETIPVNTVTSDTTSDPQEISLFGWLLRYFPSRMYLYFLLGVPRLYFTRVANIFEDTNLQKDQMERLVLESASARRNPKLFSFHDEVFTNLTISWTHFIDTLLREWKTMNLISVLLLSAIVAILQIEAAFLDPIVHYAALFSLVSALMSLLFGCMYILRFNTMRMPHKAIQWAQETRKEQSNPFWNVWILLAIPAVWLVWSLLFYILCIMAFVWRVESGKTPPQFSDRLILAIRVGISTALGIGIIYGAVVLRTFINFGAPMDKRYRKRLELFIKQQKSRMSQAAQHRDRPPTLKDVDPWLQDQRTFRDRYSESRRSRGSHKSDYFFTAYPAGVVPPNVPPQGEAVVPTATKQPRPPQTHVHFGHPPAQAKVIAPTHGVSIIPHHNSNFSKPDPPQTHTEPIQLAQPLVAARREQHAPAAPASSVPPIQFPVHPQPIAAASYFPQTSTTPKGPLSESPPPLTHPRVAHTRATTSSSTSSDQATLSKNSPSSQRRPVRRLLQPRRADTLPSQQTFQNLRSLEEATTPGLADGEDKRSGPSRIHVSSTPALAQQKERPPGSGLGIALVGGSAPGLHPPPPSQRSNTGPNPLSFSSTSGPPYSNLVPHAPHPVVWNGVQYPSSLHLYHALPFLERHSDIVERIRICQDPAELRTISRNFATYLQSGELDAAAGKLVEIQTLKFRQHPDLGKLLLGTGDRVLIYLDPDDWVFGAGSDGKGANELGLALMAVRNGLKPDRRTPRQSSMV